jgi:hypothetical protein
VAEICHELDLQQSAAAAGADVATGFHHVVWMGDLNYRLEYGQQVGGLMGCDTAGKCMSVRMRSSVFVSS